MRKLTLVLLALVMMVSQATSFATDGYALDSETRVMYETIKAEEEGSLVVEPDIDETTIASYVMFAPEDDEDYRRAILDYARLQEWPDFLQEQFDMVYVQLTEGESYAFYVNYIYYLQSDIISTNLQRMITIGKTWPKYPNKQKLEEFKFLKNQTYMFIDIMKLMPVPAGLNDDIAKKWWKTSRLLIDQDSKVLDAIQIGIAKKNPKYFTMAQKWLNSANDSADRDMAHAQAYFDVGNDMNSMYDKLSE